MTITIELPQDLEEIISQRASQEGHATTSEYIVALLRAELTETEERLEIERKILEGLEELDRGEGRPITKSEFDELRRTIRNRYGLPEER